MPKQENKVRNGIAAIFIVYIIVGLAFAGIHTPEIGKWLLIGLAGLVIIAFTVIVFLIGYHWDESDY